MHQRAICHYINSEEKRKTVTYKRMPIVGICSSTPYMSSVFNLTLEQVISVFHRYVLSLQWYFKRENLRVLYLYTLYPLWLESLCAYSYVLVCKNVACWLFYKWFCFFSVSFVLVWGALGFWGFFCKSIINFFLTNEETEQSFWKLIKEIVICFYAGVY